MRPLHQSAPVISTFPLEGLLRGLLVSSVQLVQTPDRNRVWDAADRQFRKGWE